MKELVSIITPSYNSESYISETINSVLNQTYEIWELIIIDDCSTDKTQDLLNNYCKIDNRIKLFVNEKNLGSAISRNVGIKNSSGRFIAFLDSDDIWVKEKLEKQLFFMKSNKIAFSFSGFEIIDKNGNYTGKTVDTMQTGCFFL